MRGQSEVISTAIIVAVAVALALGTIYYLLPLVVQNRVAQQVQSLLLGYSASTSASLVYLENTSSGVSAVFTVRRSGAAEAYTVYSAVVAFDENGLPVSEVNNATFYELSGDVAEATGSSGWTNLTAAGRIMYVPAGYIYLFIKDGYYSLSGLGSYSGSGSVEVAELGLLRPSESRVYKVVFSPLPGCNCTYALVIMASVNGRYYEVERLALGLG